MSDDTISKALENLRADLPEARTGLSEAEKDELIHRVGGVLTTENIIKAQNDYPIRRIPFLFNQLDTQTVVDILANDMKAALGRAHRKRQQTKR